MRAVRDEEQPVQVQGGGPNRRLPGIRGGGAGGVAGRRTRLLLPPHEGPPHHGSSRHRCLPRRH